MPELARFFGIVVVMLYRDHAPPHFHAFYGEEEWRVGIQPIRVLTGGWQQQGSFSTIGVGSTAPGRVAGRLGSCAESRTPPPH